MENTFQMISKDLIFKQGTCTDKYITEMVKLSLKIYCKN